MAPPKGALLKTYRSRLDQSKRYREQEGYDDLWRALLDMYRGRQYDHDREGDTITVNVAFSTINIIAPSVAVNFPKTVVRARRPEDQDRAAITEAVNDYWWKHYGLLEPFQAAVKDMLIFGLGWLKVGWKFEEEEVERPAEDIEADFQRIRAEWDERAAAEPEVAAEMPTDDEIREQVAHTSLTVKEDRPWLERLSIHDVFVDPEATRLADARFVAHRFVRDYAEVRKDKRYKQSARLKVQADARLADEFANPREKARDGFVADHDLRVTLYEFYDLRAGTMCVFAEQGEGFLIEPVKMPYAFGHPFIELRDYDVPDHFYPMGELEALEDLQAELNETRTAMFNDRKAFRRAHLYRPEAFDQAGLEALQSDEDNRLIPVNGNADLADSVIPLPTNTPNPQLYQDSSVIEADITHISGVSEYMRGSLSEIRRTATEASIIQDAANARAADKLAKVERYIAEVSRRLIMLGQQYLTGEQVARVVGRNGVEFFFSFERDDIAAEYDFEVVGGSTQPYNETLRRQTGVQLLQAFAPLLGSGMLNDQEFLGYVLETAFDIRDASRFIGSGPQPAPQLGAPPPDPNAPEAQAQAQQMMAEQMGGGAPPEMDVPPGVPPEVLAQLQGQVGLNLG